MPRILNRGERADGDTSEEPRERPAITRHSVHVSQEAQATREDVRPDDAPSVWRQPMNLDAPKPRDGMVQRWIIDGSQPGSQGEKNWMRKMREGWRPRDPDTVPERERDLYASFKMPNGQDAIRMAGLILCEMSRQIAMQRYRAVQDVSKRQKQTVPPSIDQLNQSGRAGIGPVHVAENTEVSYRGRQTATMV